jgi:TonB-dependent SusC/RagA subfamily outer membrane receptor
LILRDTARVVAAIALLAVSASIARAQMTITGRVTAGDRVVSGASVQIPELRIETRTTSDGTYNMLIPGSAIRGQRVRIVARDRRYGSQALDIALEGRPLIVDFVLRAPGQQPPPPTDTARNTPGVSSIPTAHVITAVSERRIDSTAFLGAAASLDFASAIAGRLPGLLVTSANAPGASAPMVFRGPRSLIGAVEPLVVVDGVPIDSRPLMSGAQRFGLGGFDYGTTLQDLSLDDIASVSLLDGGAATLRYGSRAANGVLLVTTKRSGNAGWEYSVATRYSGTTPGRMPSYQNRYGQGLGGQFEFFDGAGGGINDNVAENWGPALQGQPIVQASYLEPRRPDVRPWVPHSLNVRDYYEDGSTFDAFGALGFGDDLAGRHLRASVNARNASGLTPGSSLTRVGATIGGAANITPRLALNANAQVVLSSADQRAGTGFDEINPVSQFARMGRQVDMDSLRAHIVEGAEQINWIYTNFNNPFFQALRNRNTDDRTHLMAGATATYNFSSALQLTFNAAYDNVDQNRSFDVGRGWIGGYPTALGRGDFAGGGSQRQTLGSSATLGGVAMSTTGRHVSGFAVDATLGADIRSERFDASTSITDRPATGSGTQSDDKRSTDNSVSSVFGMTSFGRGALSITAGVRADMPAALKPIGGAPSVKRETTLFPTLSATYDLSSALGSVGIQSAILRGQWWQAGNEITARGLSDAYTSIDPSTAPAFGIASAGVTGAEKTTGLSLGGEARAAHDRFIATLTAYRERSSNLVVVTPDIDGNPVTSQEGEVSNNGIEAQLTFALMSGETTHWDITGSVAKNSNTVDAVGPGATAQIPLGPTFAGATLYASVGSPLGAIVGSRYLRDATGQLLLKNGLPIADASGVVALGSAQPDWSTSVGSRARFGPLEFDVLVEARLGGHLFSATNRWGQYSGSLTETLVGRDTGLVIAGVDSATGQPNSVNVSSESYFHALGDIAEAFVYDASYAKLRDARVSYALPLHFLAGFRESTLRVSVVGRNLFTWAKAPNIDPETAIGVGVFQGFEMGQLPGIKSFGVAVTVAP